MTRPLNAPALHTNRRNQTAPRQVRQISSVALAVAALTSLCLFVGGSAPDAPTPIAAASESAPRTTAQMREAYGQISLSFEANRGQADEAVNFVARGAGYTLTLSPTQAVFALSRRPDEPSRLQRDADAADAPRPEPRSAVLRVSLVGADRGASAAGLDELEGKVNYLIGDDPARWRTSVPAFGRVRYAEVYPGIDMVYYGNQRQLEYDFVVAPGRDARRIALEFAGADTLEVEAETGDLLLRVGAETIRQHAPVTYQEMADGRRGVESRYELREGGRVGFEVGEYDPALPLVIDPVILYSTYLGGSNTEEFLRIAVDSSGSAYVCGSTTSTNFPTVNPIQGAFAGGGTTARGDGDIFVTKLNPAGTAFVYSTYLGGSGGEQAEDIAVDSSGSAYLTGDTGSTNFPTANAFRPTKGFGVEGFVTKLNAAGSALVYSTYFDAAPNSIAVDSAGSAYITGFVSGTDLPTVNPIQSANAGDGDAFLTKFNPAGSALVYSTYLGGNSGDEAHAIAVDSSGSAYITGFTFSSNFPLANAVQSTYAGPARNSSPEPFYGDAFVTRVNTSGTALVYSTYLGGGGEDSGNGIALDPAGSAHVTGFTNSTNFPVANAIQSTLRGDFDAFVTKLNPAGTALVYSTYLGGGGEDAGNGIALDSAGNAHVGGGTGSADFPTASPIQTALRGDFDAFVAKLNPAGSALLFSTYLGGGSLDVGRKVAVDASGNIFLTGITRSTDFPTVSPAQAANGGGTQDAFVTKLGEPSAGATVQFSSPSFSVTEGCVPATLNVTLTGAASGPVSVDYTVFEGTARQKTDFTYVAGTLLPQSSAGAGGAEALAARAGAESYVSGTLTFAAGETSKEVTVLITEDGFAEGTENLSATLSNPRGAGLGSPATTTLNIQDNETVDSQTNPLDDAATFVCQNYHDFLHRQPDPAGHTFWTNGITQCGSNQDCVSERRHNVAAAFFLSIEFQQTGYFVYRAYEAGLDRRPQYEEFMRDLNAVGQGVEVGVGDWPQRLAAQRTAFAERLVERAEFGTHFPDGMTAGAFADKLFANVGATPAPAEREAVVAAYGVGNAQGRAAALMASLDTGAVYNRLYNSGFVLVEYFGFLRRDPEDPPDSDLSGFDFWLGKMDSFTLAGEDARLERDAFGRIKRAEMIRAFIVADEYRKRFGK